MTFKRRLAEDWSGSIGSRGGGGGGGGGRRGSDGGVVDGRGYHYMLYNCSVPQNP